VTSTGNAGRRPDDGATDDGATEGFGRKQVVGMVVTLVVLVIVFAVVLPQLGDYDAAWSAIQGMSVGALLALVVAAVVVVLVYALPYQAALPGLAYGRAFVVRQTSFMISNAIPAGGTIGLGVQYAMLSRYGIGPAPTTAAIGITSVWNTLVTLALPVLALALLALNGQTDARGTAVAALGLLAMGAVVGLLTLVLRRETTARSIGGLADRILRRVAALVHRQVHTDVATSLVTFRAATVDVVARRWPSVTVTNVIQQLAQYAVLWVALVAVGAAGQISVLEAFAAFAFARLGTFIPVTPGGLGTVDAAMTALLQAFGTDPDQALAATLVWRAATYFPQILLGTGTFLYFRRTTSRPQGHPSPGMS
jgi:uncharacterized protein (TIRG00374 family)